MNAPPRTGAPLRPSPRRAREALALFVRGLAMGAADIVPGVSGGTIALITGIYERLIAALGSLSLSFLGPLLRGEGREAARRVLAMRWGVLIPVFSGVMLSAVVMSRIVPGLMNHAPGPTYAFFFGLILAAIWAPFARLQRRSADRWVVAAFVAVLAWFFVGLQPEGIRLEVSRANEGARTAIYPQPVGNAAEASEVVRASRVAVGDRLERIVLFDPAGVTTGLDDGAGGIEIAAVPTSDALAGWAQRGESVMTLVPRRASLPMVFVFGVIAISAMILPGLSGAFLMLFFGQYHALLSAIHGVVAPALEWLGVESAGAIVGRPWIDEALFLGVFNLGVLVGLVTFSRAVRWLLAHAHDMTMAALIGLMLGGLRQPVSEVQRALAASSDPPLAVTLVLAAGLVGAGAVTALNRFDARSRRDSVSAAARTPVG